MFCPKCGSEFRPGFTRCEECGVDLVDRLLEPAEAPLPPPNPAFKTVYKTTEMVDAVSVNALLEAHGIESSVENYYSGISAIGMPTSAAPFQITVPAEDANRALEVLQKRRKPSAPMSPRARSLWMVYVWILIGTLVLFVLIPTLL